MTTLPLVLREAIGKDTGQIREFLEGMVSRGQLKAYSGIGLRPTQDLSGYPINMLETPDGFKYRSELRTIEIAGDGSRDTGTHHFSLLERLSEDFDTEINSNRGMFNPYTPEISFNSYQGMIKGRLVVMCDVYRGQEHSDKKQEALIIYGETDSLFGKICEFVLGE